MNAPSSSHKPDVTYNPRPRYEVADIFRKYLPYYLENHSLSLQQFKIAKAIVSCRTSVLGGHIRKCSDGDCGHEDQSYNSCGDRHCPKCQGVAKNKWLKKRLKELLPAHHYHVVFTVPHLLNDLALYNKTLFYDILFEASSKTLKEISSNPTYLGAKMGFLGILHRWGQTLMNHPHIHYIVPGGGIAVDDDGSERWIELPKKEKFLLPRKVMADVFRGKFIELLKKAYYSGQLILPDTQAELVDARPFEMSIDRVVNRRWNVFAKQPFSGPAEVLLYVGRYTHRVAISNHRILSIDDGKATFEYKDYKDEGKRKTMTLSAREFIRRFLLHVLPKGYHKIRMYGFLANSCRAKDVEKARNLILANHSTADFSDEMVERIIQSMEEYRIGQ
ncbi:MAG: IS91 family transposase, partial [Proteobacteria bacterium]|nr:IS91 family transposase [Pseudomonadota bacterium]